MNFTETGFKGLIICDAKVYSDNRGYFFESFNKQEFSKAGIDVEFVQENESRSQKGVLRGLHYQLNPFSQAKLVRVVEGEVLDVVVDIRKGSATFGKHFDLLLSAENKRQLFIPRGFAHGFSVLSDTCIFQYKCDNYYAKESEEGILFSDAELGIDWRLDPAVAIISAKDKLLPPFKNITNNFIFK